MLDKPLNLAKARILISNDDGVHAPGLKMLVRVTRRMAKEVWVVAPEVEQSAASHSLTLRRPLRIRRLAARRYAVDGTPTDAVMLGLRQIMKDKPPDLLLSGVNRGGNLGEDVTYSGTIAAAMEATLLGVPAIALSQERSDGSRTRWTTAEHHLEKVVGRLVSVPWPPGVLMSVNFPDVAAGAVTGVEATREGRRRVGTWFTESTDPYGRPYYWLSGWREAEDFACGTDLAAVARGAISVTPLSMDLTHRPTLRVLKGILD